jgi:hypothetical protein
MGLGASLPLPSETDWGSQARAYRTRQLDALEPYLFLRGFPC